MVTEGHFPGALSAPLLPGCRELGSAHSLLPCQDLRLTWAHSSGLGWPWTEPGKQEPEPALPPLRWPGRAFGSQPHTPKPARALPPRAPTPPSASPTAPPLPSPLLLRSLSLPDPSSASRSSPSSTQEPGPRKGQQGQQTPCRPQRWDSAKPDLPVCWGLAASNLDREWTWRC